MSDQYAKPTAQTFISGEPGTTGREPFDEFAKPAHGQGQHNLGQGHGATGAGAGLAGVGAGAAGAGLTGQHSHHDHHSGSATGAGLTGAHSHHDHHSGAQAGQTGQTGASRIAEDTAGTGSTGINKERTGHGAGAAGAAGVGAAAASAAGHHHGDSHNNNTNNNNNLSETNSSTTGGGIDPNVKGSDGFFKEIDPKHPMNHHDDKDFHPHGSSGAGGHSHSHNDRVGAQNQEGHKYESTGASGPTTSGAAGTDRFDSSRDQSSHSGTQEGFRDVSQRGSDRSTGGTGGVGALGTTDKDFTGRDRIADRGAYNDSDGHFKHNTDGPGGNNALTGREGDVSKNPVAQSNNAGPATGEQVGNTAHPEHHKGLVEKVKDALHK